jgi:radical SAM-linked protein
VSETKACRVRLTFRKGEPLKYISHLDLLRAWERMLRRAGLPVAYSQGFNPHMKVTIAMPLPVGCTGEREVADVILEERIAPAEMLAALEPVCPEGMEVTAAQEVPLNSQAMPNLIRQATYRLTLSSISEQEARQRVVALLEQREVQVQFRDQSFDLRPLIGSVSVGAMPAGRAGAAEAVVTLEAILLRDEKGRIGRPDVLLNALGVSDYAVGMCRTAILFDEPHP